MNSKVYKTLITSVICGLCLAIFSCSVFADTVIESNRQVFNSYNYYSGNDGNVTLQCIAQSFDPYYIYNSFDDTGASTDYLRIGIEQQYIVTIYIRNSTPNVYTLNFPHVRFMMTCPAYSSVTGEDIDVGYTVDGVFGSADSCIINTAGSMSVYPSDEFMYNGVICLPANGALSFSVLVTRHTTVVFANAVNTSEMYDTPLSAITVDRPSSCTLQSGIDFYNSAYTLNNIEDDIESLHDSFVRYATTQNNYLHSIDDNVQSILDAYTSTQQGATNLTNETATNNQKLDDIHQSEASWYSQNSQAIESTGLSNFEFSTSQQTALTGVFSLFQRLWTALGDFTFVITFTLMMSFATFFLRHNPVKKTQSNNYHSSGGNNSGSSS